MPLLIHLHHHHRPQHHPQIHQPYPVIVLRVCMVKLVLLRVIIVHVVAIRIVKVRQCVMNVQEAHTKHRSVLPHVRVLVVSTPTPLLVAHRVPIVTPVWSHQQARLNAPAYR